MSKLKKIVKRYLFFLFLLLLNVLLLIVQPKLGREVISLSLDNLLEMLSIIPPIFLLLGLMDVWVPKETIMKFMGKDAGIKGGIFAFVLGSFSSGPLYASFPVAMVFLKKGVSLINIFIFLGAWSTTKIPMMLFEITQLGSKFNCNDCTCHDYGKDNNKKGYRCYVQTCISTGRRKLNTY